MNEVVESMPSAIVRVDGPQNPTPAMLLQLAVQQGADLEKLERLMALQERWEANEARKAYNVAFAAFKAEAVEIIKRKRVHFTSQKGTTDYKHAELSDVIEAVTPALSRHGLSTSWALKQDRDWIEVTCILKHTLGYSESATLGGPPDISGNKNVIQAIASTKTMLERQTLKAVCGVAEKGDDNDGGHGSPPQDDAPELQAGRDSAMQGMQALTAWWGSLTARQRSGLNNEFPALRRAAQAADQGGANA